MPFSFSKNKIELLYNKLTENVGLNKKSVTQFAIKNFPFHSITSSSCAICSRATERKTNIRNQCVLVCAHNQSCVCVCLCVCVCMCVCACAYIYTHVGVCGHVCLRVCLHALQLITYLYIYQLWLPVDHFFTFNIIFLYVVKRLAKISILTSNATSPSDPSLTSNDWVIRHYQEEPYGKVGVIEFDPVTEAQHVEVFSENIEGLALAEVLVFGKLHSSK